MDADYGDQFGDRYCHFNVGGTPYKTLLSTIKKMPGSLLSELVDAAEQNSPDNPIEIDRNAENFNIILNMMRDNDIVHAEHLFLSKEKITGLSEDLAIFKFHDWRRKIKRGIAKISPRVTIKPKTLDVIYSDLNSCLGRISRPMVLISLHTISDLRKSDGFSFNRFMNLFDLRHYDVRIMSYESIRHHTGWDTIRANMGFYINGFTWNRLMLRKDFDDHSQFKEATLEFLIAIDMVMNHPPESAEAKIKHLSYVTSYPDSKET